MCNVCAVDSRAATRSLYEMAPGGHAIAVRVSSCAARQLWCGSVHLQKECGTKARNLLGLTNKCF